MTTEAETINQRTPGATGSRRRQERPSPRAVSRSMVLCFGATGSSRRASLSSGPARSQVLPDVDHFIPRTSPEGFS